MTSRKPKPRARKGTAKLARPAARPARPAARPAKKPAAGPAVRGKRGHATIDQQKGLREYIDAMLAENPKPTYNQMIDRLKGTGFWISRSALARHGFKFEIQRGEQREFLAKAKRLLSEDPSDVLAVEDAITNLLNTRFLEGLLEDGKTLSKEDLALAFAHARLQSSSAQRERARQAVTRGVNAAVRLIRAELSELLKSDAKLLAAVLAKLEQARQKLLTGGTQ